MIAEDVLDRLCERYKVVPKNESGCKYCRDGEVIGLDLCKDEIMIETDGKIHVMGGGDWELKINYCPMCGRQLCPPKEAPNV